MKTIYVIILVLLMVINFALAKEETNKQQDAQEFVPTISDVEIMLPLEDLGAGFKALEMLRKITEPESYPDKASLLAAIYKTQNTVENDNIPDIPGPPTRARMLQLMALEELAKMPTATCGQQVELILQDYLDFTKLEKGNHPRARLQLSMAQLINAHINSPSIRSIGSKYTKSSVFKEWTKGRIATGLLEHQVNNISYENDPNLAQRLNLILETACLPSLEQMLKAPKRLTRSAGIVSKLINSRPEKLLDFIENKGQLSDPQRYFLAYAFIHNALQKVHMKKSLVFEDFQLIDLAGQWQQQLISKTEKITDGDQLLNQAIEKLAKTQ